MKSRFILVAVVRAPKKQTVGEVSFSKLRVELLRPLDLFPREIRPLWIRSLNKQRSPDIGEGELRMSQGVIRIGLDRLFEEVDGRLHLRHSVRLIAALVEAKDSFYIKLVSDRVSRVFIIQSSLLCRIKAEL